jgi:hypothetical protein
MATVTQLGPRAHGRIDSGLEVVAMILSDGSVVEVPDSPGQRAAGAPGARMANGTVTGGDWTLWWERRIFD